MSQSSAILSRKGVLAAPVNPGVCVRIDPELVDKDGNAIAADEINPGNGFLLVRQQGTTFDVQNISGEPKAPAWSAKSLHSDQLDASQAVQTTVGATGANPSPDGAVAMAANGIFQSAVTVATGVAQNIAHGLGVAPRAVIVSAYEGDNGAGAAGTQAPVIQEGAHDASDVIVTCTAGASFKVLAFA